MNSMYDGNFCMYLRKSRADIEAEQRGEGETLARHEKILMDLAKRHHIHIGAIYKEVVSGESIQARPKMQQLLEEINAGIWDGVLVMEVERLARGDTQDQGIVAKAFKYAAALIVTPLKTYDPTNEYDEEYFEFGLFMSRREYKTIKRRLQTGRHQASKEGKWPSNKAPYGYRIVKLSNDSGFTLEPEESELDTYHMIMQNAAYGVDGIRYGDSKNAKLLNQLGIPPRNRKSWSPSTVKEIRTNVVHLGKVRSGARKCVKRMKQGRVIVSRPRNLDYEVFDGLHPAICDEETWQKAQEPFSSASTYSHFSGEISPLSGLVVCGKCGRKMAKRKYPDFKKIGAHLICQYSDCSTVSSPLSSVESEVLDTIKKWANYEINPDVYTKKSENSIHALQHAIDIKEKELDELRRRKDKQFDLLETGVYSEEVFLERSSATQSNITQLGEELSTLHKKLLYEENKKDSFDMIVPKSRYILENYDALTSKQKNQALKELIDHIVYHKDTKNKKGHRNDVNFTLDIYPKVPKKQRK